MRLKNLDISKKKINFIDTAFNYKNSEKIIGNLANKKNFKIITKLPRIGKNINFVEKYVKKSPTRLKKKLHAILVHSIDDLKSNNLKNNY